MTLKISFAEVRSAQQAVADGIEEMNRLTRQILAQAQASQVAMQAPAGRITAHTFDQLGGGGRALAETLTRLHDDLSVLQQVAVEGSDAASAVARRGSAVAAGMAGAR